MASFTITVSVARTALSVEEREEREANFELLADTLAEVADNRGTGATLFWCDIPGCGDIALHRVYWRRGWEEDPHETHLCKEHVAPEGLQLIDLGGIEWHVDCPHCGTKFGV